MTSKKTREENNLYVSQDEMAFKSGRSPGERERDPNLGHVWTEFDNMPVCGKCQAMPGSPIGLAPCKGKVSK